MGSLFEGNVLVPEADQIRGVNRLEQGRGLLGVDLGRLAFDHGMMSKVSRSINTSFVERQNGTDRHRNARKTRKTYRFSKNWRHHESMTYLTMSVYSYCWPVRTLRIKDEQCNWRKRSPAMAAALADHFRSIPEWQVFPSVRQ